MLSDAGVELGSNYEWPIISIDDSRNQVRNLHEGCPEEIACAVCFR